MKRVKRTCNVLARGCFETVWAKCRWIGHNRYWTKRSFLTEANVAKLFKCKLHLSLFNDILQHEPPLQASASLIPRVWISSYNQKYDLAGRKRLHIFSAVLGIQDVDLKFFNHSPKNNGPSRKEWWIFYHRNKTIGSDVLNRKTFTARMTVAYCYLIILKSFNQFLAWFEQWNRGS